MNNKLNFEKLLDWIEGHLSASEAEQVATFVAADATLQEEVAWIRAFHQVADQTKWAEPPVEVLTTLSRQFSEDVAKNRPPALWERLIATLKFDSQTQPVPAGVRATALSTERQLVFQTTFADIAVTIQLPTQHKKYTILGQVLVANGPSSEVFSVQLVQDGVEKAFIITDEGGEFVFENVPKGEYELFIHSDRHEYMILVKITI